MCLGCAAQLYLFGYRRTSFGDGRLKFIRDRHNRSRLAHTYLRIRRKGEFDGEEQHQRQQQRHIHTAHTHVLDIASSALHHTILSHRLRVEKRVACDITHLNMFFSSPAHHCPRLTILFFSSCFLLAISRALSPYTHT